MFRTLTRSTFLLVLIFVLNNETIRAQNSDFNNTEREIIQLLDSVAAVRDTALPMAMKMCLRALEKEGLLPKASIVREKLHSEISGLFWRFDATDEAIPHIRTAMRVNLERRGRVNPQTYGFLSSIASFHARSGNLDSSRIYFFRAAKQARLLVDKTWYVSGHNNVGFLFLRQGQLDSAEHYFKFAIEHQVLDSDDDSILLASIYDNLAICAARRGRFFDAIDWRQRAITLISYFGGNYANRKLTRFYLRSGGIYDTIGQHHNALKHLEKAEKLLHMYPVDGTGFYRIGKRIAQAKGRVYENLELQKEALRAKELEIQYSDSLLNYAIETRRKSVEILNTYTLDDTRRQMRLQAMQLSQQREEIKANKQLTFALGSIAAAIVLLSVMGFLVFRRRATKLSLEAQVAQLELKNRQLEQDALQEQLDYKEKDLNELAAYLGQNEASSRQMLARIKELMRRPKTGQKGLRSLMTELQQRNQVEDKVSSVKTRVGEINNAFFSRLDERFPELTQQERELCSFVLLDMSNTDIAALRSNDPSTIRVALHRLRKKLNVKDRAELRDLVKSL